MEAQISTLESETDDVCRRRWEHYPTRNDSITSFQDRHDWIVVARDIMTKWDKHPENISKIASSGSSRVEVIKSFTSQKPQRSLWNILIGIFNSAQRTKTTMPTVTEMDALFEELNPPKPSPALEQYKLNHPDWQESHSISTPRKHLLESPIIPHTSRRTRWVLAGSEYQDHSMVVYYPHLTPKLQEVFRPFYGYVWVGNPADPISYNGHRRSISMIAIELQLSYQTVYARFHKLSEILWWFREQENNSSEAQGDILNVAHTTQQTVWSVLNAAKRNTLEILPDVTHVDLLTPGRRADFLAYYGYKWALHDPTLATSYDTSLRQSFEQIAEIRWANKTAVYMQVYTAYKQLQELSRKEDGKDIIVEKQVVTSELQLPSFLQNRRPVTPIPKRPSNTVPQYSGETKPTQVTPSRLIRPPQAVPEKFSPAPPCQHTSLPPKQTQQHKEEPTFLFEELVTGSTDVRTIPQKAQPQPEPVIKESLWEIPQFASYREALIWAQEQKKWREIITKRTKTILF